MCIHYENVYIHNWSMAIHNWNKDIHNWNINFLNWILDVHNWIMDTHNWIIKSLGIPGVTLCFCTGSYAPRNCHEMKSKRFDWILSNKCSHRVWPWLWPWPWIFKVKFWNSPISGIERPIDNEQSGVIHDHDRDLFVTKMMCKELPDSDQGDFRCRRAVDSSCWYP